LLAVEFLAAAVFLHHHVRNFVDPFISGEPAFAFQAFAAAANGVAFLTLTRIHHLIVHMAAEWAFHGDASWPIRRRLCQSSPSLRAITKPTGTIATNVRAQMK